MALIEAVFRRPTSDRVIPFSVIASDARVPVDEVEHLVMKALSFVALPLLLSSRRALTLRLRAHNRLKLIRGTLDQVSSTTSISWVQPRVLDRPQIAGLKERLTTWSDRVTGVGEFTQLQGAELFAQ